MGFAEGLETLRGQWAETVAALSAEEGRRLAVLVRLVDAADEPSDETVSELTALLLRLPSEHSVRRALLHGTGRFAPAPPRHAAEPGEVEAGARERLLAAPSLNRADLARNGVDPAAPGLIRLAGRDRRTRYPAFQFAPDGRPFPVVTLINELLDADADPWGVADWWLGPHAWLAEPPARLLGGDDDRVLVEAAWAVVGED